MKKKFYYLKNYEEDIDLLNTLIKNNLVSLNFASNLLKISKSHLKKIIEKKISKTSTNLNRIKNFIKEKKYNYYWENLFKPISNKVYDELHVKNIDNKLIKIYSKKILFYINILKKIENYELFFNEVFYINNKYKRLIITKTIDFLKKNQYILIKKDIIFPGLHFKVFYLSKKTKSSLLNKALYLFETKKDYFNCMYITLIQNKNKQTEKYLISYAFTLYIENKFDEIILIFNTYFKVIKKLKKQKSYTLKIFYLSILTIINSKKYKFINTYIYTFFLFKYLPVKKSIFSNVFNDNYNINLPYKLDSKTNLTNNEISYTSFLAIAYISNMFLKFELYEQAILFTDFIISKLPKEDYYFPYFYQIKYLFFTYFGDINNLKMIIYDYDMKNTPTVIKEKFRYKYMLGLLEKDLPTLEFLNIYFYKKASKENYNLTYKLNVLEKFFYFNILNNNIKRAFNYNVAYLKNVKDVTFHDTLLYFIFIFIYILKNRIFDIFEVNLNNFLVDLKKDIYSKIFTFESKFKYMTFLYNYFSDIYLFDIYKFKNLTLLEFFILLFKKINLIFSRLKKEYKKDQIKLIQNKKEILNNLSIKIKTLCSTSKEINSSKSNRNIDILGLVIEKYPHEVEILKLFSGISKNEDIFAYTMVIKEYNYIFNLLNDVFNEFLKFLYKNNINNKSPFNFQNSVNNKNRIDFIKLLENQEFNRIIKQTNFNFKLYIEKRLKSNLVKLENERINIHENIKKSKNNKLNITNQFLSVFNDNIENEFLRFEKAYMLYIF